MPPFYPDQYQDGYSDQFYYQNYNQHSAQPPVRQQHVEQPYGQYVQQSPQQRIQVNIPPRQSSNYLQQFQVQSQSQYQYDPIHQNHNPTPTPPLPPPPPPPQQYFNQQPYVHNNQYQQAYQPPQSIQRIVPPAPTNYKQPSTAQYKQSSPTQYKQSPPTQYNQYSTNNAPHTSVQFQPPAYSPVKIEHSASPVIQPKPRILQEQPNMARVPAETKPLIESKISVQSVTPVGDTIPKDTARKAVTSAPVAKVDQPPLEKSLLQPAIILTLADEYIEAARNLEQRTEDYHILMSTAMGCLRGALNSLKLAPIRYAQVSLKYAQLLYDETNNLDEAEIVLTKAIDLSERMKYIDLKYALQILLAKILFRSKPRAAIRDIESMIQDIVTYKHTAWEYPFRLQAVFFLLESRNQHNIHDALQHLEKIQTTASAVRDHVVFAFSAILEALLHLRTPGPDSVLLSQQALAKARSHQLNPDVEHHAHIPVLMEMLELMWVMNTAIDSDTLSKKRASVKDALYASLDGTCWTKEQTTMVRISSKSLRGIPVQVGGLIHELNGRYYMVLSWLRKKELEALGFLLTGGVLVPQNYYLHGAAEKHISEGYKIINDDTPAEGSIFTVKSEKPIRRGHILSIHFLAESALMLASKGDWDKTSENVKLLESHMKKLGDDVPEELRALTVFLHGCIAQGNGDLDAALRHYQSQHLILRSQQSQTPSKPQKQNINHALLDLQLLATMSTAFIIRLPDHPQHSHLDRLLNLLATHFPGSTNQTGLANPATALPPPTTRPLLQPTHALLLATLPNTTILQTKSLLAASLNSARRVNNSQIMSLCLTLMYDRFFRGGIQDTQAVKCARAASHHVRAKVGSPLWVAMTGVFEAESLDLVGGHGDEAKAKRDGADAAWRTVPDGVRRVVEEII